MKRHPCGLMTRALSKETQLILPQLLRKRRICLIEMELKPFLNKAAMWTFKSGNQKCLTIWYTGRTIRLILVLFDTLSSRWPSGRWNRKSLSFSLPNRKLRWLKRSPFWRTSCTSHKMESASILSSLMKILDFGSRLSSTRKVLTTDMSSISTFPPWKSTVSHYKTNSFL